MRIQPARIALGLAGLGAAAVVVALPEWLSLSNQSLYTRVALAAMVAVGLSLLTGFAGQVSFGQGGLYAFGAYTAGICAVRYHWPAAAALAFAPVLTAAGAYLVAIPLLRLRGHYLAFATLAVHLIILAVLYAQTGFTGGEIGLAGIHAFKVPFASRHLSGTSFAIFAGVLALLVTVMAARLVRSRAGRAMQALATNEAAAAALGVEVASYRRRLFVLSAAYAGLAGGLYAYFVGYLSPDSFPVSTSVEFVVMIAIGGMGSVWGAPLGALALVLLQDQLSNLSTNPTVTTHFASVALLLPKILSYGVYGLILTIVLLFFPRGLVPGLARLARLAVRRSAHVQPAVDVEGRAGDVAGVVGREPGHEGADLVGPPHPADRDAVGERADPLGR
jgi:branched-chain amino acid transport system permease protein